MTETLAALRARIDDTAYAPEGPVLRDLLAGCALSPADRAAISTEAAALVREIRAKDRPGLMEVFLAEYGLSTEEGVALMCLAEALLRVPDAETMDALIEDKIAPSDWGRHLGKSASPLVNASTWALMLTGRVLDKPEPGLAATLRGAVKRLGEPVIRTAVGRAMREMGRQFVLGEDIDAAMDRAAGMEAKGYTYSYDMLGEAARTDADARRYLDAYGAAIARIAQAATSDDVRANPGISVKLSALHPRYEVAQHDRVMAELTPRLLQLALQAREANMGLNIDAEEADRLSLSLDVIETVLADPRLAGWDGFGVVVQAYGQRAGLVLDWLHALAAKHDRRLMVRLVKGAYWDTEIKRAQVAGVDGFPVFTRKPATDVSYIANARKMLGMTDRIYPQFATHNAHTVAAILQMGTDRGAFEFQRLHGMGESLHDLVMAKHDGTRCRIYAPVGAHRDLLAYLVRRLLENGANSSFVNQIVDEDVAPEEVAADPLTQVEAHQDAPEHPAIARAPALFGPGRRNSRGWDLAHAPDLAEIEAARAPHRGARWQAGPLIAGDAAPGPACGVVNPADPGDVVGQVRPASDADVDAALAAARPWDAPVDDRAAVLRRAADLYEDHFGKIFALVAREAGKTLADAVGELREAVDFLRFYADEGAASDAPARGVFACISPWNFPLAIFTGQIAAALAAGNGVLAKPAEQTPLIAHLAVTLLHRAGVPRACLQLLPGDGATVGARLTSDARVGGVAFTGSTETARLIRAAMADHMPPGTPLIAETGGLNAMIVDSTALPEQAVADILASSFQSAGQRCSALRCLYVQEDIAESFLTMLQGAMAELRLGDPWDLSTDVGPLIEAAAKDDFTAHIDRARTAGRLLWQGDAPPAGHFLSPTLIRVDGIAALEREIFGPVLHVATFRAEEIDSVIDAINSSGYGLTFGLHSRIDDRVQHVAERLHVGNLYVNRNQIGAIVGSQPFGGEGLSGTGPKAGGPHYLARFRARPVAPVNEAAQGTANAAGLAMALAAAVPAQGPEARALPGPTGESNRLTTLPRPPILCLGPGPGAAASQARAVRDLGGAAVEVTGEVSPDLLETLAPLGGVLWWGDADTGRAYERALARRAGPILPLIAGHPDTAHARAERHLCIDTTASGGNAVLLAEVGSA
ncbi:bifunctional proline dehydrogenase/L-glutamate gamma-semialdehyde dehydrogenase PutA [Rhodovulum adriaticum]|uniref:Bifunctional protein PutA n=1 Tax=Rhodovulum adriaticum TaxID=35804 RepID=A0A4R2NL52_RHOAD|nr:bifunctional proline dehydrogenase/L-glutamate gamma-semialdehyde dehydrogenase PutA [Rhodovulum adriaticum]MBK1635147.1 bifunctional proline dehydrogenase/L-glutamate gamma-semialdehyde dehydrogenase [Rhodovulum adriaticum]TCP22260.1 L-proline dehydrogenase /delta-1-pyrroline-5-carboxylate dehydrogenase [Rhodovulum adriaticum]